MVGQGVGSSEPVTVLTGCQATTHKFIATVRGPQENLNKRDLGSVHVYTIWEIVLYSTMNSMTPTPVYQLEIVTASCRVTYSNVVRHVNFIPGYPHLRIYKIETSGRLLGDCECWAGNRDNWGQGQKIVTASGLALQIRQIPGQRRLLSLPQG